MIASEMDPPKEHIISPGKFYGFLADRKFQRQKAVGESVDDGLSFNLSFFSSHEVDP